MKLQISEVTGSLFSAPTDYSLAHCVGADFKMGRGIAVEFRNRFGQVAKLKSQGVRPGGVAMIVDGERFIYYLVTKEFSYQVPTYSMLFASLNAMRSHMLNNGINKLAIPKIGCGLDRLNWYKVKEQIIEVFANDQVDIVVYEFIPKKD